jgi:hypothetical protein
MSSDKNKPATSMGLSLPVLAVGAMFAMIILVTAASAQTITYTYTGSPYTTWVSGAATGLACPAICGITASFIMAQPIPPSSFLIELNAESVTFTDGLSTVTETNPAIWLGTDKDGIINQWSNCAVGAAGSGVVDGGVPALYAQLCSFEVIGGQHYDVSYYYTPDSPGVIGFSVDAGNSRPGTWTCSPNCGWPAISLTTNNPNPIPSIMTDKLLGQQVPTEAPGNQGKNII